MVHVKIGPNERPIDQADESWIHRELNERRAGGVPVCVQVRIETRDISVTYITPGCRSGGGSGRLNAHEMHVLEMWRKHRLDTAAFTSGDVVAFRHALRSCL